VKGAYIVRDVGDKELAAIVLVYVLCCVVFLCVGWGNLWGFGTHLGMMKRNRGGA